MQIKVLFFASLREQMGRDSTELEFRDDMTVNDIWYQVSGGSAIPENLLCAVNLEYTDRDRLIQAGDEVAFFPPVTGG